MPPRRPPTTPRPQPPRSAATAPRRVVNEDHMRRFGQLVKECFQWEHEPRPMQIEAGKAQVRGEDVLVHAPTGHGKTAIVAAPHALPENKGRITLFVSPLIALQEEMVQTFKTEFKLAAIAINSTRKHSLASLMKGICRGEWAIVLISPEMLLSRRFINAVLRDSEFSTRILSLAVDEAHTVSHWGAQFRKKYGTLGVVRAFFPPKTSVVAMSATLTPRVRRDVLKKLQFGENYINIDLGNNRPNVSLVVRACHRTLTSFADLDFVIPRNAQAARDIPATFIYCDKKKEGDSIVDYLRNRLPTSLQEEGIVRPFNATLSHVYRKDALQHFRAGNIRILVCTDAAGMGCNIPNIEVVVQWKLPDKLSTFVQRAGRAARRPNLQGLAVLLVEPSAYGVVPESELDSIAAAAASQTSATRKTRRAPKGWAKEHGRNRGASATGDTNTIDRSICLTVTGNEDDEGLAAFCQTGDCRRRVWGDAYKSNDKAASGPCCDLCDPSLLLRTLPGPAVKRPGAKKKKKRDKDAQPAQDIVSALRTWRHETWTASFPGCAIPPGALLSDDYIDDLALESDLLSERELQQKLEPIWLWWPDHGRRLWRALARAHDARLSESESQAPTAKKRTRSTVLQDDETPELRPPASQPDDAAARPQAAPAPQAVSAEAGPSHAPAPPAGVPPATAGERAQASARPRKRARTAATVRAAAAPPPPPPFFTTAFHHYTRVTERPDAPLPAALCRLTPAPTPQGPPHDASRIAHGSDGKVYFCTGDGFWWIQEPIAVAHPPPIPAAPFYGRGRPPPSVPSGSTRSRGRGRGRGRGSGAADPGT